MIGPGKMRDVAPGGVDSGSERDLEIEVMKEVAAKKW
jgi:hypothetical protein